MGGINLTPMGQQRETQEEQVVVALLEMIKASSLLAELWGLLKGLEMAWKKGIRRLEVELDSEAIMLLVQRTRGSIESLQINCKDLQLGL